MAKVRVFIESNQHQERSLRNKRLLGRQTRRRAHNHLQRLPKRSSRINETSDTMNKTVQGVLIALGILAVAIFFIVLIHFYRIEVEMKYGMELRAHTAA